MVNFWKVVIFSMHNVDKKNHILAKANMRFLFYNKFVFYSNVNDEEPIF